MGMAPAGSEEAVIEKLKRMGSLDEQQQKAQASASQQPGQAAAAEESKE